jgi:hypothetical protein
MPSSSNHVSLRIAVVTPTYLRTSFLARFIRQMIRQDYGNWRLFIVHDGEDPETRNLVEDFARTEPRIHFTCTDQRANDFGITPRLLAVKLVANCDLADYTVFWDDDNAFFPEALTTIARCLEDTGRPEVLLVPIRYQNYTLPARVPVEHLGVGQVDMANLVVRSPLAARVYPLVWRSAYRQGQPYIQDFLFLNALRKEVGPDHIRLAKCQPLGRHDGLRILETFRWQVGIPYLGLSHFSWVSRLRRGIFARK